MVAGEKCLIAVFPAWRTLPGADVQGIHQVEGQGLAEQQALTVPSGQRLPTGRVSHRIGQRAVHCLRLVVDQPWPAVQQPVPPALGCAQVEQAALDLRHLRAPLSGRAAAAYHRLPCGE